MKVAIPIWDGRISPVMDTACRLLLVEIVDDCEVSRTVVDIPQVNIPDRVRFLSDLSVDVLICGAISHQFERMLAASGIMPKPWFRGDVDEVIAAHSDGILQNDNFLLPGGGRRRCQRRGRCRERRPGFGRGRTFREER